MDKEHSSNYEESRRFEAARFSEFESRVVQFFDNNNEFHLGFGIGGSSISSEVDYRYSDIDSNVIVKKDGAIEGLVRSLANHDGVQGLYFDTEAPYPLLHAIIDVNGRLYRWDVFLFNEGVGLEEEDPLRVLDVVFDEKSSVLSFADAQVERYGQDDLDGLDDPHLHTIDWLFYLWNKSIRSRSIDAGNIQMFQSMLSAQFGIEQTIPVAQEGKIPIDDMKAYVHRVINDSAFKQALSDGNLSILEKLASQMTDDVGRI